MRRAAFLLLIVAGTFAEPPKRAERVEWGLYQIHWGRRFGPALAQQLDKFASKPDYVMFYRDLGRPYPRRSTDLIRSHGATPVLSLELWHWMRGRPKASCLPAIVQGKYDEFFRTWARAAREDGKRVLLRFGFEMNGEWFSWSGDPDLFKEAWRRVHAIFREEKAKNVEWVWAPNILSVPKTPENGMHRYYPGDEVVDWVALDGYNFGDDHDQWHTWTSFEAIFDAALNDFAKRYPKKPVMIAETGCAPGDPKARAEWIRDAHAYLERRPQVKALVWFNYDKSRQKEPNFRIDATPGALEAFNDTFARKR